MSYYSALVGYPYEFNLSTDESIGYEPSSYKPSTVDEFVRDTKDENKTYDALDLLPKEKAPVGDIYKQQYYINPKLETSNQYYSSNVKSSLDMPEWKPSRFLNPIELRNQRINTNKYIMDNFYSRSVPQRISDNDRGLN